MILWFIMQINIILTKNIINLISQQKIKNNKILNHTFIATWLLEGLYVISRWINPAVHTFTNTIITYEFTKTSSLILQPCISHHCLCCVVSLKGRNLIRKLEKKNHKSYRRRLTVKPKKNQSE